MIFNVYLKKLGLKHSDVCTVVFFIFFLHFLPKLFDYFWKVIEHVRRKLLNTNFIYVMEIFFKEN